MNIPNILTLIRILLIPVFTYEVIFEDNFFAAGLILVVSGLTDCLDGYIARKFNMITTAGKVLDPIADKLTQIMTVLCLALKGFSLMWILFSFLVIKDFALLLGGVSIYKNQDMVVSSNWYGKLATIIFYVAVIIIIFFYKEIPDLFKNIIAGFVIITMFVSFIGYICYFFSIRNKKIQ